MLPKQSWWPEHVVGFHATELRVAQAVVDSGIKLYPSLEETHWMGNGVYFWMYSVDHARRWAEIGLANGWLREPAIIKMNIKVGNCLNLCDLNEELEEEFKDASRLLKMLCTTLGAPIPQNERVIDGVPIERRLDCHVINLIHTCRSLKRKAPYDSVWGAFPDGGELFAGSTFQRKTHMQIAVRNYGCLSDPVIVT